MNRSLKTLHAPAANTPTTADAGRPLEDRDAVIIPATVANAGAVTCSDVEQVQGHANCCRDREKVLSSVDSDVIAVDRVARACRERGWV